MVNKRHRIAIITGISLFVFVGGVVLASAYFYHQQATLGHFQDWLNRNQMHFVIWHMLLYLVFFMAWPYYIRYRAKRHSWAEANIPLAINLRYYLIGFLLLLDCLGCLSVRGI